MQKTANERDEGSIPRSRRFPWRRKWQLTAYSCLQNSMDRGAWWGTVHGFAKSQTWLNTHTHAHTHTHTHSPSFRVPWDNPPGLYFFLHSSSKWSPPPHPEIPGVFNHLKSSFCTYLISGISFLFMHSYLTLPFSLWSL